jgi:hypothetical protein
VHLRPPSIDQGVQAGLWAVGLGLFLFFGMLAVDIDRASAFIFSVVAAGAIFFFVRLRGAEDLR